MEADSPGRRGARTSTHYYFGIPVSRNCARVSNKSTSRRSFCADDSMLVAFEASGDEPLYGMKENKRQKDWDIQIKKKCKFVKDGAECERCRLVGPENVERTRNIDRNTEQQQIEGKQMKLSQVSEAFAEIVQSEKASTRIAAWSLLLELAKPQHDPRRDPQRVHRNTAEEQQEEFVAG